MNQKTNIKGPAARDLAYQILLKFEMDKTRIDELENKFLNDQNIILKDRKMVKNLVSGVIRNLLLLDWIAGKIYSGKYSKLLAKGKTILRLAMYELINLSFIPVHATVNEYVRIGKKKLGLHQSKMINAVLRNYLRSPDQYVPEKYIKLNVELLSIKYSFPNWLVKRWINHWGIKQTEAMLKIFSLNPEFDLQINSLKTNPEEIAKILEKNEVLFEISEIFAGSFKIKDMQKLLSSEILEKGLGTIQDDSARIPVNLLDIGDNDIVLDMCAAPGGKFIQIMQSDKKNTISVAVDVNYTRLKRVKQNLETLRIRNAHLVVADGRALPFKPVFTKILLDAPCSGLGVISKHPDIKWRRTMDEIHEFAHLQQLLINQAAKVLRKNGVLVYSTCTIDPLENENVITEFLQSNPEEFTLQDIPEAFQKYAENKILRTFPQRDGMDGSFGAVLKKL